MSTNWTLGSFVPNPVTLNVLSFMKQEDKLTFAISSPYANALSHRYRVFNKIYPCYIEFKSDDNNNLIVSMDEFRIFDTSAKCGTQKAEAFIVRLLGMCDSIVRLKWGANEYFKCIFDATIYNKLRTLELHSIDIFGIVALTADQLLGLRSKVHVLNLRKCQVSNELVTDEIFEKLCNKNFDILNVTSVLYSTEDCTSMQTTVSDTFLNFLINSLYNKEVSFENFHTKFTAEGIRRFVMARTGSKINFGILDNSQTAPARAFLMEINNRMRILESHLLIIDDQHFICYESTGCSNYRSLSLSIPLNLSSTRSANIDEELDIKSILTSSFLSDNAKIPESKNIRIFYKRTENSWADSPSNVLRLEIVFNNCYVKRSFVLIDIDQKTAAKFIRTCLIECENIDKIYWDQLDFSDEVYEMLKTVSDKIVRFEWKQTTLSSQNLVEFFRKYPQIAGNFFYTGKRFEESELSAKYLTDEIVCCLLENGVTINVTWTGDKKEAVTTLTDQLLVMLAERNSLSAIRLSIKGYSTGFTIQGIETLTPTLGVIGSMHPSKLSFTLNDSEEVKAVRFLSSIQLNPDSIWRIVSTSWDDGFLQSFKVVSNVHCEIYIEVDFDGSKKTVDHRFKFEEPTESNYRKLLLSGDYSIWQMKYFLEGYFKRLDLLEMIIIIYDYDLDFVKAKVREYLNEMDSDIPFDDRFFSLPFDQQAFVLNMIYNQHKKGIYSFEEHYSDNSEYSDYYDYYGYSDNDW